MVNERRRKLRRHPLCDVHGQETCRERVRSSAGRVHRQQLDPRKTLTTIDLSQAKRDKSKKRRAFSRA